jgi:hypothetical protein
MSVHEPDHHRVPDSPADSAAKRRACCTKGPRYQEGHAGQEGKEGEAGTDVTDAWDIKVVGHNDSAVAGMQREAAERLDATLR